MPWRVQNKGTTDRASRTSRSQSRAVCRLQQLHASQARVATETAVGREARLARRRARSGVDLDVVVANALTFVLIRQEE